MTFAAYGSEANSVTERGPAGYCGEAIVVHVPSLKTPGQISTAAAVRLSGATTRIRARAAVRARRSRVMGLKILRTPAFSPFFANNPPPGGPFVSKERERPPGDP